MSRTGAKPIKIPNGVDVSVNSENIVTVKGPKGELIQEISPEMDININNDEIVINRPSEYKKTPHHAWIKQKLNFKHD